MPITDAARYLAENCYGYGHWDAPYWFIGLEEGQSKDGQDTLDARSEVCKELTQDGLCDIRLFHNHPRINEKWFKGIKPPTQTTWRYLILTLKAFLDEDTGLESIRSYQRDKWGSADQNFGETCLIELSGVASNSLNTPRERDLFRSERIESIHKRLLKHQPRFAIIYGTHQHGHWGQIAHDIGNKTHTKFVFAESPTAYTAKGHSKKEYWKSLGQELNRKIAVI